MVIKRKAGETREREKEKLEMEEKESKWALKKLNEKKERKKNGKK